MLIRYLRFIAIAAFAFAIPAAAHHDAESASTPRVPRPGAETVTVNGYSDQIVVEDLVSGHSQRFPLLTADDGRRYLLVGPLADRLATGATIKVTARQDGQALFADSVETVRPNDSRHVFAKAASASSFEGTLRLGHADNFDGTPSEFFFALESADGRMTRVELAAMLGVLRNGMRVTIDGRLAATGDLVADRIAIEAVPNVALMVSAAVATTGYIVLPIKFPTNAAAPWTYGADPFTPAALNTAVFGPTPSVLAYYNEVSYGQHLISGITANNGSGGFLLATVAKPATCDINAIAAAARNAATARGYNLAAYPGVLYVFNNVSGCGWSGLAYVSTPIAYANNTTNLLVIAHELGHNFGLAHAASLDCGVNVIGGVCTSSEYGDPFDVMGNNRAMHFNSAQKAELNWLPAGSVLTHSSGTTTYTLSPIENPGGAYYAVKVPASGNRTYWIEYRQPIGFDSAMSAFPNNGVQIRVASPFESICSGCYDDTEFLDMTPATAAFTDGTLLAGQSYTDSTYSIGVNVISATASLLTVQVSAPGGAATTTTLVSSVNPSVAGANVTFTASVTGLAPTGSVNFTNGGTSITGCSAVALTGSGNTRTAACSTNALAAGTRSIVAAYSGNASNAASASATLSQVVKSASTTTVASSANPSIAGANVTFTASVTGLAPTGSVNFTDGGTSITGCSAIALTGSGNTRTAACSTASLGIGTHNIAASYGGDAANVGSASATLSQGVNSSGPTATTTTLTSSANPSVAAANVTFTASVTGLAPTGSVNFTNGGTSITGCSAVALTGSGNTRTAACTTNALAAGTRSIVAAYGGNATNAASASATLSQVVKSASTTTVASSANPSIAGTNVTFTASVTGLAPTGSVNFTNGGTSITGCSAITLTGSGNTRTAACSTASLGIGTHNIAASYGGDAANVGSVSATLSQGVNSSGPTATTTTLTSSANPSVAGANVTFTASVTGLAPTGSVNFTNGGTSITGCSALALTGSGNTRTAACTTNALAAGTRSIVAAYSGNATNAASASATLSQVVHVSPFGAVTLASTDFTGDRKTDIVLDNGAGSRLLYTMNGMTVLTSAPLPGAAPGWVLAGIGDFNGDGKADLLWQNTADPMQFWIYLMNGTTITGSGPVNVAAGYLPTQIGDFDGNGKDDILWENAAGARWIYFMNGVSIASAMQAPAAATGWVVVGAGDFNGDGKADLLWQNTANPTQFWIYLLNGATVIGGGPLTVAAGYAPTQIADFNGDGKADILWENGTASPWIFFMNGASITNAQGAPSVATGWAIAGAGDFNGDGKADLLLKNTANPTQLWIYLMSGATVTGSGSVTGAAGYLPMAH